MENLKDSYKEIDTDAIKIQEEVTIENKKTRKVTTVKKQKEIKELKIKIENTKSQYPMISDVDRIYKKGFKGQFGKYTAESRKAFGYLEFSKYTRENKIIIPNSLFEDFSVINDGAVKIYLAMKLAETLDQLTELIGQIYKSMQISVKGLQKEI